MTCIDHSPRSARSGLSPVFTSLYSDYIDPGIGQPLERVPRTAAKESYSRRSFGADRATQDLARDEADRRPDGADGEALADEDLSDLPLLGAHRHQHGDVAGLFLGQFCPRMMPGGAVGGR